MGYKKESSKSRMALAITLIAASFLSAFFLTTFSARGSDYWVAISEMNPGHELARGDIELHHFDLNASAYLYVAKSADPVGMISVSKIIGGQILSTQNLSSRSQRLSSSAVPISIRGADVASGIQVGEGVDIYWVIDSQNGDLSVDPLMILGGVILLSFDQKSKNFGTDAALTVAVEETQVLRLLRATTHGRLVVVRAHV